LYIPVCCTVSWFLGLGWQHLKTRQVKCGPWTSCFGWPCEGEGLSWRAILQVGGY